MSNVRDLSLTTMTWQVHHRGVVGRESWLDAIKDLAIEMVAPAYTLMFKLVKVLSCVELLL